MPVCENCQTPYDEWQHFCLHCGQPLKAAPLVSRACPQCGLQMPLTYTYCHTCGAPLQGEAAPAVWGRSRTWLWGAAAVVLFSLGVTLGFLLGRQPSGSDRLAAAPGESSVPSLSQRETAAKSLDGRGQAAAALQPEVAALLDRVRTANLHKDMAMYMDTLSALYPQLNQKRQEVLRTWEKFDFEEMTYTVQKIQESGQGMVVADVAWQTLSRDLATSEARQDTFRYRLWISKELDRWKIRQIEELQP